MKTPAQIESLLPTLTAWRHHLHSIPEIGLQETRTAAYVAGLLRGFGLEVVEGVGGTGVVATLRGTRTGGRSIGFRAELDALPMDEPPGVGYRSGNPGRMHACGHDGHMAMLLGAARVLAESGTNFAGAIHFIFQPGEEGLGGALAMLADGLFDRFPCDEIYATHNASRPLGQVAVHRGVLAAAADVFHVEIRGKGGHAATPHDTVNPLHAAAKLLLALESLPARITDARLPSVVTVAALNGGDAFNVIPDRVRMSGTVRCLNNDARATLETAIRRQVAAIELAEGVEAQLSYDSVFSVTANTAREADHVIAVAKRLLGAGNVVVDPPPEMGSEDFGYMLEQRPGCYFLLGQEDADHLPACHDTNYDFNDRLLELGVNLWAALAKDRLGL